ncbi:type 2 lantibiotic biosynthesis protein LanM [Flavobacterium sp. 1]|uniref:type 2 lanthipeptide synthetase LanM n=1 Tax=Flavobacterium sp. 1 TaxID=2035200 RepID=UPI000C235D35|nr:type 2 lanthipeptide synthetase LanM [Flavobacterium sp. 1]PJJ08106.1 type 2 lantibiotic biosynthesis protein LanM [Flavobacterium sp. 1]
MKRSPLSESIYFKSLTPFEILNISKQYQCSFEKNGDLDYLDYWKKTIANDGSEEIFKKYCTTNNLASEDISKMISSIIAIEENINFPDWIFVLEDVLNETDVKKSMSDHNHSQKAFYHLFLPFLDCFFKKLTQNLTEENIPIPNNDVIDQLGIKLYEDLYNLSDLVLFHEFNEIKTENSAHDLAEDFYYKKFVFGTLSDKFQDLFLKYPMLARKLSKKTSDYIVFITTVFKRFENDKPDLKLLLDKKFDQLTKLHLSSGDQHNGESTIILEFENSHKLVYKPTNLSITNSYNEFLNWVNENMEENLKTFKVLDKGNHGWLEFIENSPCNNIEDVKLYYERAGILLGVTYFLNAKDFHCENIIASGNCPVLIDHETILSPELKQLNGENQESQSAIFRSIFEASLLPTRHLNLPYYMYGFGSSKMLESDFPISKIQDVNKDSMKVISEMETKKLYKLNKPFLNDSVVNLAEYEKEFKTGFQKLYNLILKNKKHLQSEYSPITNFYSSKIRFVNRHTKVYAKILKFLNKQEYLADSIKYGIKLEMLAKAYIAFDNGGPILDAEREQMLRDDIPVFYIKALDNRINLPNKKSMDLIKCSAIENIHNKVKNASIEDFENQIMLITDSVKL